MRCLKGSPFECALAPPFGTLRRIVAAESGAKEEEWECAPKTAECVLVEKPRKKEVLRISLEAMKLQAKAASHTLATTRAQTGVSYFRVAKRVVTAQHSLTFRILTQLVLMEGGESLRFVE